MNKTIVYAATVEPLCDEAVFERALTSVCEERRQRVMRCRHDRDKRLSLGVECLLRLALREQGITQYELARHQRGKPFLTGCPDLHISLSHSKDVVMCALSPKAVGCDVQAVVDCNMRIAKRCFDKAQYETLLATCDDDLKAVQYTRYWVQSESVWKTTGEGIKAALHSDVSLISSHRVTDIDTFEGYLAAVYAVGDCDVETRVVSLCDI